MLWPLTTHSAASHTAQGCRILFRFCNAAAELGSTDDSSLASAAGAFAEAVPLVSNSAGAGASASASAQAFAQSLTSAGIPQSVIAQACATVGTSWFMSAGGHA